MNKLIIGALILVSMLTVSGCAKKSADVTSNNTNTQTEQTQPKNDSSNNNDNNNNNSQNNKSGNIKKDDSQNNKSKSDNLKSNNSNNNVEKNQSKKNNSDDKELQNDSYINKKSKTDYNETEDTTTSNSNIKKEPKIENNNRNEEKSQTDNSSKKDYNNSSKNLDSTSKDLVKSTLTNPSSNVNKETTVKPTTKPTKKEIEIAKKTNTPSKNNAVKDRVTQNNKASSVDEMQDYYGTWVISEVIGYTRISADDKSPLNKTLVLSKNSYTNNSFGFTIENPRYLIANISKDSFCNSYRLDSLKGTGLTGNTIKALDINSSTNPNSDFDELYIQNGSLIYLQDGVFFRCVKQ